MLQKIRLILIGVVVIVLFSLLLFSDPVGSLLMSTITHTDNTLEKSFTSLELSQKRSQNKKDSKKFDPFREELLDLIQGSKVSILASKWLLVFFGQAQAAAIAN